MPLNAGNATEHIFVARKCKWAYNYVHCAEEIPHSHLATCGQRAKCLARKYCRLRVHINLYAAIRGKLARKSKRVWSLFLSRLATLTK